MEICTNVKSLDSEEDVISHHDDSFSPKERMILIMIILTSLTIFLVNIGCRDEVHPQSNTTIHNHESSYYLSTQDSIFHKMFYFKR